MEFIIKDVMYCGASIGYAYFSQKGEVVGFSANINQINELKDKVSIVMDIRCEIREGCMPAFRGIA